MKGSQKEKEKVLTSHPIELTSKKKPKKKPRDVMLCIIASYMVTCIYVRAELFC